MKTNDAHLSVQMPENIEKQVLTQFIEHIPQFVWWKDTNSVFLGCNENMAHYVGFKNAYEIIGLTDFDIYENKKEAEFVRKIDKEIIDSGKSQLNFEEELTMPKLGKRWLSTSKMPLYDSDQNIIGTIGWFHDITEIKELKFEVDEKSQILFDYSLELNKTIKKLELANLDIERFTYAASHDLKGPLKIINNLSELILRNKKEDCGKEVYNHVNTISRSAMSIDKTVSEVLDYGLSGTRNEVAVDVDLNEIIALKVLDLNPGLSCNKTVKYDLLHSQVKCYKKLMGLLFYNLILNGLTYNNQAIPRVEITSSEDANYHYFTVKDNGIGIKKEEQASIFKPFEKGTLKKSKGPGLGLSICQRVISLHHGEIWVDASSSAGSVIKFSISKRI